MPVNISVPEGHKSADPDDLQRMIDRAGELQDKIEAFKESTGKEYSKLCEQIMGRMSIGLNDPEGTRRQEGQRFVAILGKLGKARSITDMHKLRKVLGDDVFMKIVKVNLGDVDKYTTEAQRETFMKTERGDSRSFSLKRRA